MVCMQTCMCGGLLDNTEFFFCILSKLLFLQCSSIASIDIKLLGHLIEKKKVTTESLHEEQLSLAFVLINEQ